MKKIILLFCVCLLLFGIIGCSSGENKISEDLYNKGIAHNNKISLLKYQKKYEEIPKEIESFKNYIKANNFKDDNKIFIEAINNIDSLYNETVLSSILDKISNDLDRREVQLKINLLQSEGEKILKSKNIQKMMEYNSTFDNKLKEISSEYMDRLVIVEGWEWINDGDYTYIRGSVKNVSDTPIEYFKVVAEYMDSNGNVLDTDYTNSGETVRPGNEKKFEIIHEVDDEYIKVRIFIDEVK